MCVMYAELVPKMINVETSRDRNKVTIRNVAQNWKHPDETGSLKSVDLGSPVAVRV